MVKSEMAKPLLGSENDESAASRALLCGDTIGILGTGDFARSLAARLLYSGFKVVVGSRNPKRNAALFPADAEVTGQEEAVKRAQLLFVAIFREHYSTLCALSDALSGKTLIDVSNNLEINVSRESNAEYLASLFPQCTVVKAFNVVSAWALQAGPKDGNNQVLICSDSPAARSHVASIGRSMGFIPVDMGALCAAREVENIPLRLLPLWRMPCALALGLFLFFYLYNFVRAVLHPYLMENKNKFYKLPVELMNVTVPCVSYVMLSLVYAPGVLAAVYQLHNGTKYKRFPSWLDEWMIHRKQLGLVSFFLAALHAIYSLCLPMRRSARYQIINDAAKQVKNNVTSAWVEEEVWRMEIYVSLGIIALGILSLLAVSSLPSVGNSLNWKEFTFIQSKLGFAALVVGTLHTLTFGWRRAFDGSRYKFYLPPTFTLTLVLPFVIILARIIFLLPCFNTKLRKIRRGWEKDSCVKFTAMAPSEEGSSIV
ncbi:metalloreductase STEAP3 isoform X2 [Hyla sarda]|nr:metalloreductase STEAP3 isoform X2 [Hyla sarda]XP_056391321.1 metalloreductase STEAP3 isoform X2 [Hyla sarda]XP_056391322.1 metalloreductase STEAP3 isoform X2 [Hyla sarda]XP_056391323.1 metalloreductase STEAP3 isoform X2 [Hyla sarda]XP_056391324.1 metalloreductase STEAP3 isoform X2 [Hyla sarda]XP_056391325.1 metalloreductase STEAP3 isoform X2 [Hyla sarda]